MYVHATGRRRGAPILGRVGTWSGSGHAGAKRRVASDVQWDRICCTVMSRQETGVISGFSGRDNYHVRHHSVYERLCS